VFVESGNSNLSYRYRFASHPIFPFWAMNIRDREALAEQISFACDDFEIFKQYNTPQKLRDELLKGYDSNMMKTLTSRAANIQGTDSYWYFQRQNLVNAIYEYGAPHIFFTLSAADYQWGDLQQFMPWEENTDISKLDFLRRKKQVIDNPHIATWFFQMKMKCLMEKLIPILGITHYWYRIENQNRGSDHSHGCLWLKYAPNLTALSRAVKLAHIAGVKLEVRHGSSTKEEDQLEWLQPKDDHFNEKQLQASRVKMQTVVERFKIEMMKNVDMMHHQHSNIDSRPALSWHVIC